MPDAVNRDTARPVDGPRWRALPWRARCLGCGEAAAGAQDLSAGCRRRLPWLGPACRLCALPLAAGRPTATCGACLRAPPPLHATRAVFRYAPPLDRWLPRFKFHRDLAAGLLLSQLMLDGLADASRPQLLLPVPLHRTRLRARGYDQALELARPLARAFALPLRGDLLQRVRATAPQSELDATSRHRNLQGAFAVAPRGRPPAHVALVDDVMTTGATLHAAALAQRAAGVERVDAWVSARVP
jgi:ComF family protein